jgi:ABC-type phosphate/phosphonate transport system permease subunit
MNEYMRFFDNFFGFFKNIGISFYDSVIYDDRYKYILDGLFHTILIALFAVIIGIVLAPLYFFIPFLISSNEIS